MTEQELELLVRNASLSADLAAMEEERLGASKAQVTIRVVRRTIEFLVGNDLIEVKPENMKTWLTINPPFPHTVCTDSPEPLAP